ATRLEAKGKRTNGNRRIGQSLQTQSIYARWRGQCWTGRDDHNTNGVARIIPTIPTISKIEPTPLISTTEPFAGGLIRTATFAGAAIATRLFASTQTFAGRTRTAGRSADRW